LTQFSFFGLCPSSNFLEKLNGSEASTVSIFRQRSTSPGGLFRSYNSQSLGTIERVNLCRYALENRSIPREVAGKWLLKN